MSTKLIKNSLQDAHSALTNLLNNHEVQKDIAAAGELLLRAFAHGGKVICCGNGGSMCDAMHFAEECSGRFRGDRDPLPVIALSDAAHMSCVANDYGFEQVFSRSITALASHNDVILLISTSGTSKNILEAAKAAKEKNAKIIALTGKQASLLQPYADVEICTTAGQYSDRIQELHIKVLHILVEYCEKQLFSK